MGKNAQKEVKEVMDQAQAQAPEYVIGANLPDDAKLSALIAGEDYVAIKENLELVIQAQNEWLLDNDFASAKAWNEKADNLVGRYTNIKRKEAFDACIHAAGEDPTKTMIEACKMLTFESIRIKESEDKETGITSRVIEEVDKDIDLLALSKYAKTGIGADKLWMHKIQKLNYLLACKVGQAIGDSKWSPENLNSIKDSFTMSDIAKEFDMGKNPCSNTQMLKTLTTIVVSMIGEGFKPTSHDVAFLGEAYSRRDRKAKTIQLPNHKTFVLMLRDVCNNCINKQGYSANSKAIKKQK